MSVTRWPSLNVPPRIVPVTSTVSEPLQKITATLQSSEPPDEITVDSWLRYGGDLKEQSRLITALRQMNGVELMGQKVGGVPCFVLTPADVPSANRGRFIVNYHAGGYTLGEGEGGTCEAILLAAATRMPVFAVDYRMPPAFPFPAAVDDAIAVWKDLITRNNPRKMAICGSSSGGGMALAVVQRAKAEGLALPGAVAAGTPWSDLSKTGDSYYINDLGQGGYDGGLEQMAKLYANGLDLRDPRLSPVYGDFRGFPPTILTSGTRDLFLSNTVRVDQKLREAGVETRLQVLEGHGHATYLNPALPESKWVFSQIAEFINQHLDK